MILLKKYPFGLVKLPISKDLRIVGIDIEDISGFTKMDSLETLTVLQGYISEENISALENNGITVMIENKEE